MTEISFPIKILLVYLVFINFAAVIMTVVDKIKAKQGKWRTPERALFNIALFGGALGEYLTMLLIRHKTKHAKFMIGLPIIIFIHIVAAILIIIKVAN